MERIGIDLGGTKIEIAVLDAGGTPVLRRRVPTPSGDYGATVEAIGQLVADAERDVSALDTASAQVQAAIPAAARE